MLVSTPVKIESGICEKGARGWNMIQSTNLVKKQSLEESARGEGDLETS